MLKRISSQEIFIILSALFVLLFMYATIIFSAPINELTEMKVQDKQMSEIDVNEMANRSTFAYLNLSTEVENE